MAEEIVQLEGGERKFQVCDYAYMKDDLFINKPGVGQVLYAAANQRVRVMSYDPSALLPLGVRTESEPYRNVPVSEDQLLLAPRVIAHAESMGL